MVTMSNVWDRATEVMRGRAGQLATIGAATVFLPTVLNAAVTSLAPGAGIGVSGPLTVIVTALSLFGGLAIMATATDPEADTAAAFARAGQRLLPAVGLTLLLGVAFGALLLPVFGLVAGAGLDLAALRSGGSASAGAVARPGLVLAALVYILVLVAVLIWVSARLAVLNGVIVNERRGLGAIGRSWSLTRGLGWRIVGVLLLVGVVMVVALLAATSVVGLAVRLAAGADGVGLATFLGSSAGGVVTAAYSVILNTFVGQLYVAVTQRGVATVFE